MFYEPTSVLDPHLTSSPADISGGSFQDLGPLVHHPATLHSDVWDPDAAWLLSDKEDIDPSLKNHYQSSDDPISSFFVSDLPFDPSNFLDHSDTGEQAYSLSPQPPPPAPAAETRFERAHLDLLIGAAQAAENDDLHTAHVILARFNQYLPSSGCGPLERAAFHFRDALLALLPFPDPPTPEPPFSAVELVRRIAAHKAQSDFSPFC